MHITIKLGESNDQGSAITLEPPGYDPLLSEILEDLREQDRPSSWYIAVMERGIEGLQGPEGIDSVPGGLESLPKKANLFLAMKTDAGLKGLEPTKRLSEYHMGNNATLYLICSSKDFKQ